MNSQEKPIDGELASSVCGGTVRFFADPIGTEFAVWRDREAIRF